MSKKTFGEWVVWFEKRSGETFATRPGFNLEFNPNRGFMLWRNLVDVFEIDQTATDDWEFWGRWVANKGKELGCKRVITSVRREPESYARLTGGRIILKGIDDQGRDVALIEWNAVPMMLNNAERVKKGLV